MVGVADPVDAVPRSPLCLFTCSNGRPFPWPLTAPQLKHKLFSFSVWGFPAGFKAPRGSRQAMRGELVDKHPNLHDPLWESSEAHSTQLLIDFTLIIHFLLAFLTTYITLLAPSGMLSGICS